MHRTSAHSAAIASSERPCELGGSLRTRCCRSGHGGRVRMACRQRDTRGGCGSFVAFGGVMKLSQVLVAIDFSEQSGVALAQAAAVARHCQARLTLLWVEAEGNKAPSGAAIVSTAMQEVDRLVADLRAERLARLQEMADRVRASGVDAEVRVEIGGPAEVIVSVAGELGAGLVVTGTKGLTGFKRFFLGSVAAKVVRTSDTNVLVARG